MPYDEKEKEKEPPDGEIGRLLALYDAKIIKIFNINVDFVA